MQENKTSADELIALIIQGVDEVKGQNVNLLDLREIENTVCDYFIVCNGTSNTHVNAIVGSIHVEGEDNAEWVLMDYVNVVVHVFQKQVREFYDIEGLWGDAKFTTIESSVNQ